MDFIRQIIEGSAQMLAKILGKETDSKHELIVEYDKNVMTDIHLLVFALFRERKINEAEDLLFAVMQTSPSWELFETGMDFYEKLSGMSDAELDELSFPRQEIEQGLDDLRTLYFNSLSNTVIDKNADK